MYRSRQSWSQLAERCRRWYHHWYKGLLNASRVFALTAVELYLDAKLLKAVKDEFEQVVGSGFKYVPLLGDRKPALDYRVSK
jgi:aminobenzoyl-glutamate utilization protein B